MAEREENYATLAGRQAVGIRTLLAVPLLREGDAVGAIMIRRTEVDHLPISKSLFSKLSQIKQ